MHDIAALEEHGVPGVFVASSEFEPAAQAQSHSLGFTPQAIYVAHPIQDRTDAEITALADQAIERLISGLVAR